MIRRVTLAALLLAATSLVHVPAFADGDKTADDKAAKDQPVLKDLPPDAHVKQSTHVDGKTLSYTVTVGTLPVRDDNGKTIADVVFTAYTVDGKDRPVTFAMNGGPGAASVYLNLGAIGPKRVRFGLQDDSSSDPATLVDNAGTWLDFTDLVFIDPVGTGFSRSRVPEAEAKKQFYETEADIHYLSRVIYDWLLHNHRMNSRKYLVGESYGGFRGPRVTHYLQTQLGVAMNGVVLVSPYLNPTMNDNGDVSPMPWMMTLPSIAASHLERQKKLNAQSMHDVIEYTRGEYATTLMRGRTDPEGTERMIQKVTQMTGLDPVFVRRAGGRLETQAFLREVYRAEGKLGSRYDSNVTSFDPFPFDPTQRNNDPILDSIIAPTTTAMVDFVTRTVGWKVDARYNALSYDVNKLWDGGDELRKGSVEQLREAVAIDPKLRVLIVHGWDDLSCPFMGSVLTVDQMPAMNDATRVQVKEYPGGHMFYSRPDSQQAMREDVRAMYSSH